MEGVERHVDPRGAEALVERDRVIGAGEEADLHGVTASAARASNSSETIDVEYAARVFSVSEPRV